MDLAKLEFTLRPRGHWEAIDLGFALARRWFMPLVKLWLVTALPVTLLLTIFFYDNLTLLTFLIWWCKPIYEPLMVFWLSRAVFGEQLPVKTVARDWWSINRRGLLGYLTLRRLGPSRSFYMPVGLLEGLKGRERSKRIHILGRNQQAGFWLTVAGIHFEAILQMGLFFTVIILIPEQLHWIDMDQLFEASNIPAQTLLIGCWVLGMAIIAPFYVAGGFSLYLHRRSQLEGWDIEINFRRTVEKLAPQRHQRNVAAAAALLLLCGLFSAPDPVIAAEMPGAEQSRQQIEQVLAEPRFGRMEEQSYWKYVGPEEEEEEEVSGESWLLKAIADFFRGSATLVEILIWVGVFSAIAYLLYHLSKNSEWMQGMLSSGNPKRRELPTELFGLDVRPDSLPDDIAAEALQKLRDGKLRQALSLLYRGSLIRLITDHQLDIPGSATEGECLSLVQQRRGGDEADFFTRLTRLWLVTAYAHLLPESRQIEQLCEDWQRVYGHGQH